MSAGVSSWGTLSVAQHRGPCVQSPALALASVAAPCVCCTWLFSENLQVHSSTKQARLVRPLLFTDGESEVWTGEKDCPRSPAESGRAGAKGPMGLKHSLAPADALSKPS